MPPEAFFLPAADPAGGQRLCIHHRPARGAAASASIVYVHPFAEEMNKSRRMAALQSRAFAEAGCEVLQIDLHGCGDSSGDLGDASWEGWIDDVLLAAGWLARRSDAPLWLWGLRTGCLLARAAAARMAQAGDAPHLLCWAPVFAGKGALQQFLRLKTTGDMLSGKARGALDELRARLAAGGAVEVAGYALPAAVASGLEAATLAPVAGVRRIELIELAPRAGAEPGPAARQCLAAWEQAGCEARAQVVAGPAFWQTTEIEEAPALLAVSAAALREEARA